jgi:hypothetical protein
MLNVMTIQIVMIVNNAKLENVVMLVHSTTVERMLTV